MVETVGRGLPDAYDAERNDRTRSGVEGDSEMELEADDTVVKCG